MRKERISLSELSTLKEGIHLEAKSGKGGLPDSLWETYSAFANTDGGTILLGVKEDSKHTLFAAGVPDITKLEKDFWNMVNNRQKVSANILTNGMVWQENINGKDILIIDVPRAERAIRPVYKGTDPRTGTYRRNGEGDYLCTMDEVSAMFRDAMSAPQDAKIIGNMDLTVFCADTIKKYRQLFRDSHINHRWNNLDDEIFLRQIGAIGMGEDNKYHPTAAGLLLFGYEYEITRVFPLYFLDYQEQSLLLDRVRWTDRIVSSSGEWSGNVMDFVMEVAPKLTFGLKTPFVLKENVRIDDTPLHKVLREALTNCLVHADFNGRRGIVITKNSDGYTFSNPGGLRIPKDVAIEGGVSDPRNATMLKIFSFINYGERAGSGLSNIFYTWNHIFHTPAELDEEMGVERIVLRLSKGGNEQDVSAMLELYDSDSGQEPSMAHEPLPTYDIPKRFERFDNYEERYRDIILKSDVSKGVAERLIRIVSLAKEGIITSDIVAKELPTSISTAKRYLQLLVSFGILTSQGANKNRKYLLKI